MERLTEKEEAGFDLETYKPIDCDSIGWDSRVEFTQLAGYEGCLRKLGQLEDIEEELGISLITLFNVSKNGFYRIIQTTTNELPVDNRQWFPNEFIIDLREKCFVSITMNNTLGHTKFYFKDQGVTWTEVKE